MAEVSEILEYPLIFDKKVASPRIIKILDEASYIYKDE